MTIPVVSTTGYVKMKIIIAALFKFYFIRVLKGRYISIEEPSKGRFSKRKLKEIYEKIKREKNKLQLKPEAVLCKSHGNRLMVYCGALSLAAYRGMRNEGLSHQYATLLVADVVWKLYILGAKAVWIVTRLISSIPQKRLNIALRILCKYPFNADPAGYQFTLHTMPDHLATDFTQCAVHQYMKITGSDEEMDFFRNSWCRYDFALPGYLIKGGHYKRKHTLSHGDSVCDMKWYAK